MIDQLKQEFKIRKRKFLKYSIALDLLGMASYAFPFLADITDLVFAPIYGSIIFYMYRRNTLPALIGGLLGTTEELLVMSDGIPTATIMWIYTYVIRKKSAFEAFVKDRKSDDVIIVEES